MKMLIEPKVRGFICTTAHPTGCAQNVLEQINYVKQQGHIAGPKNVLVIGASTGYGLASRIVAAFGAGAKTLGVSFEKPSSDKKTASAGWYNTAAFEIAAQEAGIFAKSLNGDAFSHEMKQAAIDIIQQDMGGKIDLVIYSLASPKRKDPDSDTIYSSALKPIGATFENKTVDVLKGKVTHIAIEPADTTEIDETVHVMGGDDWQRWIEALLKADVLSTGCKTVAYSYIGPEITYPVYRHGTIGRAKAHLEKTAHALNERLQATIQGHAYVSVNKALVTQASAAIPVVPLYISLLYKVMKEKHVHEGCIEQIYRLFADRLYHETRISVDEENRIRIDDYEMADDIQAAIAQLWENVDTENLDKLSDIEGYRQDFYRLFGFHRDDVDYTQAVEIAVEIPSIIMAD
jgi:enoyl-[acyl-carrier protein] reductase / trans-2-enoyl-CoA reductase (NAD+)